MKTALEARSHPSPAGAGVPSPAGFAFRRESFGEQGVPVLAAWQLPDCKWPNDEAGVAIPPDVPLRLIAITGARPRWRLTGEGARLLNTEAGPARPGNGRTGGTHDPKIRRESQEWHDHTS
jgi:hypothetical protein